MNEAEIPAEVSGFKLTLRMDATITIFDGTGRATDWLKQGTEASQSWKSVPTEAQVATAYQGLEAVAANILEVVVTKNRQALDDARRGR